VKKYRVIVKLKANVLDPEGKTISNSAQRLKFTEIQNLRVGKIFEIEGDDNLTLSRVEELAKKILINPVVEVFEIEEK
jgi:phosphoribosylformylglycinamidine synthase